MHVNILSADVCPFSPIYAGVVYLTEPVAVSIAIHSCAIAADLLVIILTWFKTYEIKKLAGVLRSDTTFSTLLLRDGRLCLCDTRW